MKRSAKKKKVCKWLEIDEKTHCILNSDVQYQINSTYTVLFKSVIHTNKIVTKLKAVFRFEIHLDLNIIRI